MPHSVRQQRLGGHRESRHRAVFGSSAVMLIAAILLVVGLVPPEALAGQINLSEPGLPEALATEVPPFEVPSLPINPFEPGGPQVGPPPPPPVGAPRLRRSRLRLLPANRRRRAPHRLPRANQSAGTRLPRSPVYRGTFRPHQSVRTPCSGWPHSHRSHRPHRGSTRPYHTRLWARLLYGETRSALT